MPIPEQEGVQQRLLFQVGLGACVCCFEQSKSFFILPAAHTGFTNLRGLNNSPTVGAADGLL